MHAFVAGDFNCQTGSRFYNVLANYCAELGNLVFADINRLSNVYTYCSDDGMRSSWIDHVLCSPAVDDLICSVDVLNQFVSSDHKPLFIRHFFAAHDRQCTA